MKEMNLKPCPFCGGKSVMHGEFGILGQETQWYWVRCKECGAVIRAYTTEEQAADAWNARKMEV